MQKSKSGLTYVAEYQSGGLQHKMGHLVSISIRGMIVFVKIYYTK